jgi:hypothetical protein
MGMINFTDEDNITLVANEQLSWEHLPPLPKSDCQEVEKELAPANKPNRAQNSRARQRVKATCTEPRLPMKAIDQGSKSAESLTFDCFQV